VFAGDIAAPDWSTQQTAQFEHAVTIAGLALSALAAALVGWGFRRSRRPVQVPAEPGCQEVVPSSVWE